MATRSLGSLTVDLLLRLGGFTQGMGTAARESEKTLKKIQGTVQGISTALKAGFAALGIGSIIREVVRNSTEAEDALRQLDARLKSTGGVAGVTSQELQDFSKELQGVTTFGDDAIIAMQGVLLSFTNIRGQQVKGATEAILDLATAMGTDLNSAALQVGKALNDPAAGLSALGRAGVQFSDDQEKLIKALVKTGDVAGAQTVILRELQTQFGGSARAASETLGGSLQQLNNAFGDLLEAEDGVDELTDAVKEFTTILSDPRTKEAAQSLVTVLVEGLGEVVSFATAASDKIQYLLENRRKSDLIAIIEDAGVATKLWGSEVQHVTDDLEFLQEVLDSGLPGLLVLGKQEFDPDSLLGVLSKDDIVKRMQELNLQLSRAKATSDTFNNYSRGPSRRGSTPSVPTPFEEPGPSDEFEKLRQQLEQQIALYGKVGEAAKIRYQIESGQLEELSGPEQQRVLRLAEQYDAMVSAATAAKELEQAQKQLQQAYDSQLDSYRQQIALSGEVTELQKIRYEIESGGLKGITADQQAYLETQALILDTEKELTDAIKEQDEARQRALDILSDLATPQEQYRDRIVELNELLEQGALSHDEYGRAVASAQEKLIEATDKWDTFREQAARNTQDIIADTLVNGFDEGAEGVIQSFGEMLKKLAAQAVAADIGRYLFGTEGTGDSGVLGAIFGAFSGGFATGGTMMPGQWGIVGENGPELAYAGSAPLSIKPMSGGSTTVNVNLAIQTPTGRLPLETQQQAATRVGQATKRALGRNS